MPRSATDATRFTPTTPYATAKPPSAANLGQKPLPQRAPGPAGETSQEKIRRLRAAADRARDAKVSTFDKFLVHGRVWADRIHRFTALSLIGATVIAGGVTVYTLTDMIIYNRRKRAQFYQEQKALEEHAIQSAREEIAAGTATEAQIKFINMQEQHAAKLAEVTAATANKTGPFTRVKQWLFSGLKMEEEGEEVGTSERRLGYEALSEEDDAMGERESDIVRAIEDKKMAVQDNIKKAFADEKERQRTGGPLDRLGTANERYEEPSAKTGSWFSFITGR